MPHLVVLGGELVQALLDDMVAVQILDQHHHVQAQRKDDGVNLAIASEVSLTDSL